METVEPEQENSFKSIKSQVILVSIRQRLDRNLTVKDNDTNERTLKLFFFCSPVMGKIIMLDHKGHWQFQSERQNTRCSRVLDLVMVDGIISLDLQS